LWLCVNPGTALFVLPLAGQGLLQGAWLASMAKFSASFATQLLCSSHADSISLLHWTITWYRLQLNSHIDTFFCLFCVAEFTDALCPTQWVVADGKLTLKGEIEAASKAEKLEWKPQEEQVDAFGNIVKIKVSLHMFSL